MDEVKRVRCNECMEEFEEEDIILVNQPDEHNPTILEEVEACPFCKSTHALMDL